GGGGEDRVDLVRIGPDDREERVVRGDHERGDDAEEHRDAAEPRRRRLVDVALADAAVQLVPQTQPPHRPGEAEREGRGEDDREEVLLHAEPSAGGAAGGAATAGSDTAGSDTAGSDTAGSDTAGSATAGSATAGSVTSADSSPVPLSDPS